MTPRRSFALGVVEGFFGRPWSAAARFENMKLLASWGFAFYIYAPKADRYLRRQWRVPMPAEELRQLSLLAGECRQSGLRFGVGLTPYEVHLDYCAEARRALQDKVMQLNAAGVDLLCVLFDDMRGGSRLAEQQARIVADITGWSSAKAFVVCPTYYSDDPVLEQVFGPAPLNYLQDLGRGLDPAVDVFWTGPQVCSTAYPDRHLATVADRLGRKPVIWDNHVANDGKSRCLHLYLDPWANGWSLTASLTAGLAINPMNPPALSRLPLALCGAMFGNAAGAAEVASFESQVRSMCGTELGSEILRDLDLFQNRGLAAIDPSLRSALVDKYRGFEPVSYAREIAAWLRGEFAFDPNCLAG